PLLVEDGVVGEPVLAIDPAHGTASEYRQRVVGEAETATGSGLGEADQRRRLADSDRQLLDRAPVRLDEVALQVEVLGRVSRQAELGEDRQLRAGVGGPVDPLGDPGGVAVDVADGGVDLGEGYAHGCLGAITAEVSPPRGWEGRATDVTLPPMRDWRKRLGCLLGAALLPL